MAGLASGTSRESIGVVTTELDRRLDGLPTAVEADRLGSELFAVVDLLADHAFLRRNLADSGTSPRTRAQTVIELLDARVSQAAVDTVVDLVRATWSNSRDLLEACRVLAVTALVAAAERDGSVDRVEDEVFRFSRMLDSDPPLRAFLTDVAQPEDRKRDFLEALLDGRAHPITVQLLRETVANPLEGTLDRALATVLDIAANRRQRLLAVVTAARPLTDAQEQRLVEVLSRIYRHRVAVQVVVDPDVLGGLAVRVGGEIIDGTVLSRLTAARERVG